MKNLIVSSADNNYSHLLIELFFSLKNLRTLYDFAILDCGLDQDTLAFFKEKDVQIKKPNWEFPVSKLKVRGRDNLKIQFSRFYLDKYFPGYQNYIWLDSDTWINSYDSFNLYLKGAELGGFSVTPQVDRAYQKLIDIKWIFNFPKKINSINFKNISRSLNSHLAKKFAGHYTLNAGCFGYNAKFDGIEIIRKNLSDASKKGRIFGTDQVALALSLFNDGIEFELLPAYCNWLCVTKKPKFSMKENCFVEPYLPHEKIGIMHLAGMDEDRGKSIIFHNIITTEGDIIKKTLRFKY